MEEEEKSSRLSNLSSFIRDRFSYPGKVFGLESRLKDIDDRISCIVCKKLKQEKYQEMRETDDNEEIRRIEEQYRIIEEGEMALKKQLKRNSSMVNIRGAIREKDIRLRKHSQDVIKATRLQDSFQIIKMQMKKRKEKKRRKQAKVSKKGRKKSSKVKRGRSKGRKTAKGKNRLKSKARKKVIEMNKIRNLNFNDKRKTIYPIKNGKRLTRLKTKKS